MNNKIQKGQNPTATSQEPGAGYWAWSLHTAPPRRRGCRPPKLPLLWPNPPGAPTLTPFKGATCSPHRASKWAVTCFRSLVPCLNFSSGLLSISTNWRVQEPGSVTEERIDKSDYIKIDNNCPPETNYKRSPWRRCEDQQQTGRKTATRIRKRLMFKMQKNTSKICFLNSQGENDQTSWLSVSSGRGTHGHHIRNEALHY